MLEIATEEDIVARRRRLVVNHMLLARRLNRPQLKALEALHANSLF